MRIFIGYDPRQPVAAQALAHSIYSKSSKPVTITHLLLKQMPIKRRGLTEFTFSRYLVPWLCNYEGHALFLDADMLCRTDITELESYINPDVSVSVVKNKYRFEWPSLMYFNNAKCKQLIPEYIENGEPQKLQWGQVGDLPAEWNHLVGYDQPNPNAKVVHFTAGVPCWPETRDCEFAEEWIDEALKSTSSVSFQELMGNSVHAQMVLSGGLRRAA